VTYSWQNHDRWLRDRQREAALHNRHQRYGYAARDRLMMGPPAAMDVFRKLLRRPPRLGRLYGYEKGLAAAVNRELEVALGYGADPFTAWRHKSGLLRQRIERHPDEWAYHYILCFTALELAELAESLGAATHMVELRPADPRSTNSLGTVYAFIAMVAAVNDDELYNLLLNLPVSFTTQACAQLLVDLGLTAESAAQKAYQWFTRTSEVGLHPSDQDALQMSLASVRSWLPDAGSDGGEPAAGADPGE